MAIFKTLPENFFAPLASPLREHYAALLLIFYRLFLEYQGSIERAQVVREYEDYFRSHAVSEERGGASAAPEESAAPEDSADQEQLGDQEEGANDPQLAGPEELGPDSRSPRDQANYFLRRLIAYGWLGEEVLEDFSQMVTINSWSKPYFEALHSTSVGTAEEYESHIVAVYSLLTGGAAQENGHYNLMNAHSHVRRLIESLKVLSQNIRTYLQNLYDEDSEVHEILHIHYDLYMHEVVDRAYNRLKTSENLSKYRPLINRAVGDFLKDEQWLGANAERMAVVKRLSNAEARKLMVEMLKEIRDSLRGIDPILEEIDDKNRRYSKISTQKIKTKLYSDATLQGKLRVLLTEVAAGRLDPGRLPLRLSNARFLTPRSLYTRPKKGSTAAPRLRRPAEDEQALRRRRRELELKITGQLNPKKVAEFLRAVQSRRGEGDSGTAIPSTELAADLDSFIKLIYAAGYAEAGRRDFPFEVVWEEGEVESCGFRFQKHYFVLRTRFAAARGSSAWRAGGEGRNGTRTGT
jgi:hypothetical protein